MASEVVAIGSNPLLPLPVILSFAVSLYRVVGF